MRQNLEKWKLLAISFLLVALVKPHTGVSSSMAQTPKLPSVENDLSLPTPKPQPKADPPLADVEVASITITSYKVTPPEEINVLIDKYAQEFGANPDLMKSIAKCESRFRAEAVNGSFGGMYQFLASTWSSNRNAMGLDPNPDLRFNAEEAIRTAAFKMGRDGYGAWPSCYKQALALTQ